MKNFYIIRKEDLIPRSQFKLSLCVKLTCLLMLIFSLQLSASAYSLSKINLNVKNERLGSVLKMIENQSDYRFIFNSNNINLERKISLLVKEGQLDSVLIKIFHSSGVNFVVKESGSVLLINKSKEVEDIIVTGTVRDKNGPIPSASVVLKGNSKIGTTTDANGNFKLTVPENGTLVITYIGYKMLEMPVAGQKLINITLVEEEEGNKLEDVVIVGYGTQNKAKVTGSISQVKGAELAKSPVANTTNSLIGRLPGLRATQRSGEPGGDGSGIDIRGFGNALIIVDGVPGSISQLDPNEIETFSIIKDASAAVYGVRAANGVVLVTTKKGKPGQKPSINFSTYYGLQNIGKFPELANAALFAELYNESAVNAWVRNNNPAASLTFPYPMAELEKYKNNALPSYDWFNETIQKNAPQRYANLNLSGASTDIRYFLNLGSLYQEGIWKSGDNNFSRYNFRGRIEAKLTKRITAEMNLSGRLEDRKYPGVSAASLFNILNRTYPTTPFYANNNPEYFTPTNHGENPLVLMDKEISGYANSKAKTFSGIFSLNYEMPFVTGLNLKGLFSYQDVTNTSKSYNQKYNMYNYNATTKSYDVNYTGNAPSKLSSSTGQDVAKVVQISLDYKNTFAEKHNVSALALFESQEGTGSSLSAYREYLLDGVDELFAGVGTNQSNSGSSSETARLGYVGRVNYDYDGKYLFEVAGRYDGTYKVMKGSKYGFFPSVSAGWRVSEEGFFKNIKSVDNLKIRGSYGVVGDDQNIAAFQYLTGFSYPSGNFVFGSDPIPGLNDRGLPNYALTWYTSKTLNVGMDLSLWSGLFGIEFDYFRRTRNDILGNRLLSLPTTFGASLPQENINGDNTRGFELVLTHANKVGEFNYFISPNVSWTRTKNAYLERAPSTNSLENWRNNGTDRWANRSFGYEAVGQFQNQNDINTWAIQDGSGNKTLLPGDIKYADLNGDGVIDGLDQKIIGRGNTPEIFYGLNLNANYKNFDLSVLLQGATNFNVNFDGELQNPLFNGATAFSFFGDRWRRADLFDPNSAWIPGKYPSTVISGTSNNQRFSTYWLKDATYLRVKNFELGYTFSENLLRSTGISKLRLYVSGQNVFTFDKIKYIDPEAPAGRGSFYPQQKSWVVGLMVGL